MANSGINRDEIIAWGGPETFNQALALVNSGDVEDVRYDDDTVTVSGKIARPDGWSMPVSFKLKEKGRIESHCPCYDNQRLGRVCPHVVALGIALSVLEDDESNQSNGSTDSNESTLSDPNSTLNDSNSTLNDPIPVPLKPSFYAFVSGSRASLSIALDAWYGDIDFPACSVQPERLVWLPDPDDPLVRRTRSLNAEREAIKSLRKWGFEPGYKEGDLKLYLTDPQKVLNFLGAGVPDLRRRGWRVDFSERLEKLTDTFAAVVPVVSIKDAPRGDFDVSYAFETTHGTAISPVEIQAALNRGDGYILKDGAVALLDNKAIETMHDVFRDCATSQNGAPAGWFRVRGVHAAYVRSSLEAIGDVLDLDDAEAESWRRTAAMRNRDPDAKFEPFALGPLDKVLRPYQKQGVYWMRFLENAGMGGLLADEMGLGKTLQTLTWLSLPPTTRLRPSGFDGQANHEPSAFAKATADRPTTNHQPPATSHLPNLIVCPTSLVRNWEAEAHKFIPSMKVLVLSGPDRARLWPEIDSADLVVTSYALLQRDFEDVHLGRGYGAVVLDEAQHIKNRETKNAKAVKLLRSERRLVLTGTPVENSVADVWSIFDFLMPDYLGDYESFKAGYEIPIADGGAAAEDALARLKRKLHPFILRRVKKTVAKDLPDKIVKVSLCPMDEDSQREYNEALAKTRRQAGDIVKAKGFQKSRFELLALLMKLRQIASLGKLPAFMEQLQSAVEGGHKILVFSQFVKMLQAIAVELQEEGIPFCYLDGSTKDRLGECNRFNRDPKIPVFLISLMAGGTGLNLTGADMVIHYDPWWNPAVEDQATDRAHRIGQKKTVYVMKMIASGSVEEKVLALQKRKQAVIAATVGTTDAAVMEKLTAEDIKNLLS